MKVPQSSPTLCNPMDCTVHGILQARILEWEFIGRTDVEAETPIFWPPDAKGWLIGKDPDAGKDWGQEEKGTTEDEMVGWHHWLDGYGFGWTPGVGDAGMLQFMGSQRVRHNWATELNWTELNWAIPFCRGSSQPRDLTQVSHIAGGFFTSWATREACLLHYRQVIYCLSNQGILFVTLCIKAIAFIITPIYGC